MITELIIPPVAEPFSLADLKTALRIDHAAEDGLVMRLGVTARAFIERRLGHAVAAQTWRTTISGPVPRELVLRPGNVRQVTSVTAAYGGAAATEVQGWTLRRSAPARLCLDIAPSTADGPLTELVVTFEAGRSDVTTTPPELTEAIFALTAHYYEHREAVAEGRYVAVPLKVESLLSGLREVRL